MNIIYTTFSDVRVAKKFAKKIVSEKLAACVNFYPIESTYWWKNKIVTTREVGVFIKTQKKHFSRVEKFLSKRHPYAVPCIIELPVGRVAVKYKKWLKNLAP